MKIFFADTGEPKDNSWVVIRTTKEFSAILSAYHEELTDLHIDHYDLAAIWIELYDPDPDHVRVTSNNRRVRKYWTSWTKLVSIRAS